MLARRHRLMVHNLTEIRERLDEYVQRLVHLRDSL
jgi:hypothetical protein